MSSKEIKTVYNKQTLLNGIDAIQYDRSTVVDLTNGIVHRGAYIVDNRYSCNPIAREGARPYFCQRTFTMMVENKDRLSGLTLDFSDDYRTRRDSKLSDEPTILAAIEA